MSTEPAAVVRVQLDPETLKLVDLLVGLGVYRSREEAIRDLVAAGLRSREKERLVRVARAVERLFELEKRLGRVAVQLEGGLEELLRMRGEA